MLKSLSICRKNYSGQITVISRFRKVAVKSQEMVQKMSYSDIVRQIGCIDWVLSDKFVEQSGWGIRRDGMGMEFHPHQNILFFSNMSCVDFV